MQRDYTKRSRVPRGGRGQSYPARRRRLRLLAGVALVFVLGIGLGALLGTWLIRTDKPSAQVALSQRDAPYEVTTRAYRPPVRAAKPFVPASPGDWPSAPPAAPQVEPDAVTEPDAVAEPAPRPVEPVPPRVEKAPELAVAPRIGSRKTPMWLANAVAAPAVNGRPMIALVIDDLGLSQARVRRTIALPAPLTLAFLPYGHNLRKLADAGRRAGHELIIHVNMEPKDHDVDPGPKALLTSLSAGEVRERLEWALGQFDGYIGISNHMGSRFTEWPEGMEVVIRMLKRRGLVYFDSVTSTKSVGPALARAHGMVHASRDIFLDHDRDAAAVARQLARTERIARRRGHAIAIGHPYDVTFEVLEKWLPDAMKRGFVMVPLSTVVRRKLGEG